MGVIFDSKDYRKVKILHYDINGWVMYSKWFTGGKFLQPKFEECKKCHEISRKNIAFMFGLLESCKLNDVDFGIYIEDVLTRIMYGEHVDDTFLPCGYVPRYKEGQDAA